MRYLTCFLALSLACGATQAADAWRWVDKNGEVHFSDQPVPGATKFELKAAAKPGTVAPNPSPSPSLSPDAEKPFRYAACSVVSPSNDEVFTATQSVSVSLSLSPPLRQDDSVEVSLDGRRVENWPEGSSSFLLTDLFRGSHALSVRITDLNGQELCTGPVVNFHLRQPSMLTPGARAAPR